MLVWAGPAVYGGRIDGRRVNGGNAQRNRNFIDFAQTLPVKPVNTDCAQVHKLLRKHWPLSQKASAALQAQANDWGKRRMPWAITNGQFQYPQSAWFRGLAPTWRHSTFRQVTFTAWPYFPGKPMQ